MGKFKSMYMEYTKGNEIEFQEAINKAKKLNYVLKNNDIDKININDGYLILHTDGYYFTLDNLAARTLQYLGYDELK